MSFAITATFWPIRRDRCDHARVDIVERIDVVGIWRDRFAVTLDMIGAQIYGYFEACPGGRGLGAGTGERVEGFD
jgi:hypothetical protein